MADTQPQVADFASGKPNDSGPLSQSVQQGKADDLHDGVDPFRRFATPAHDAASPDTHGESSNLSQSQTLTPSRGGTLKKRQSLRKKNSVKRSMSGRLSRTNSMKSLVGSEKEAYSGEHASELNNVFFTPVPTSGSPTEMLANRFQSWRKVLKDLITYFRDVQKSYESRAKSIHALSNVIGNIEAPPSFLMQGGVGDATKVLHDYHKQTIMEGNKAKSIAEEVINQLTNLRSDLGQKIKEIKSLSGDFKNNVDKEIEGTRRAVQELSNTLRTSEVDPSSTVGKNDPFIVRLGVDRQLERQIEEENYLHRAFLNLESSGRELESIVVGEVQKAYNAYANIITREADEAYEAVEKLRTGPIAMPKDHEWNSFVHGNEQFVDPRLPVRRVENITYPGKDNPAASEIRSGMLERKSKYLKSYTPGWYILSPTHIHEFKSPDRITSQTPVMSLTLADQKLGSHSGTDSTSHKFMLKGRQSGGMHRGHAWVFRAESYDTMIAWFNDIKALTENTGEAKATFIRKHARSISAGSQKAPSEASSEGMGDDEADQVPYSATPSQAGMPEDHKPERPNPGGRFPSALNIDNRDSHAGLAPSSPSSHETDRDVIAAAGALPAAAEESFEKHEKQVKAAYQESRDIHEGTSHNALASPVDRDNEKIVAMPSRGETQFPPDAKPQGHVPTPQISHHDSLPVEEGSNPLQSPPSLEGYTRASVQAQGVSSDDPGAAIYASSSTPQQRHDSTYGDWMGASAAAGAAGAATGASAAEAYHPRDSNSQPERTVTKLEPTSSEQNVSSTSFSAASSTTSLPPAVARAQTPITAPVLPVTGPPEDPFRGSRSRSGSTAASSPPPIPAPPAALPSNVVLPHQDKRPDTASSSWPFTASDNVPFGKTRGTSPSGSGSGSGSGSASHSMSPDSMLRRPSTVPEEMTPTPTPEVYGNKDDAEWGKERSDPLAEAGKETRTRPGMGGREQSTASISGLHVPGEYP